MVVGREITHWQATDSLSLSLSLSEIREFSALFGLRVHGPKNPSKIGVKP
jgi:hypothetical protein